MATNFWSKQPPDALHTFKLVPEALTHPIEMYDWMEVGSFDNGYITGSIPFGRHYPRAELFKQKWSLVE